MSEGKSSDYMPSEVYIERYRYRYLDINISHYWENMIPNRINYLSLSILFSIPLLKISLVFAEKTKD